MKILESQFEFIYNEYAKEIFNIAFGYTKNKEDAKDIVQNSFLKLLESSKDFKTYTDIKYYLIRIAINESINLIKSYNKKNVILNNEFIINTLENKDKSFCEISAIIDLLPNKYRTVIILHYYDLLKIKDISNILKISESAVKKRLERGRKNLKEMLRESDKRA